ncbi:MAG TPA: hypothetical protein VFX33_02125 [Actinomycetales bacterium]|nr:hypothetical protein [Actinomycetales bacterium]
MTGSTLITPSPAGDHDHDHAWRRTAGDPADLISVRYQCDVCALDWSL